MNSYYVVKTKYIGPNRDQHIDDSRVEITTVPARTNMSNEPRIEGWCGCTNDWDVTAYGEYPTIAQAREAITELFGDMREEASDEDQVVAVFRFGEYIPMSREDTANWAYDALTVDIGFDTTQAQIAKLADEYRQDANEAGYEPTDLQGIMLEYRQSLRD